tara:strand:- start:526 stop:690 length:165 start_codon:yes stop_codon:yes gene_type:complete
MENNDYGPITLAGNIRSIINSQLNGYENEKCSPLEKSEVERLVKNITDYILSIK